MTSYRLTPKARVSVGEIEDYTANRWGEAQAAVYIGELFSEIGRIVERNVPWRALPARWGVSGFSRSWRNHILYWRLEPDGTVTIVAILHQAMDQAPRISAAFSAAS